MSLLPGSQRVYLSSDSCVLKKVRRLGNHVIECIVLIGDKEGRVVLIPRMNMIPNNDTLPFRF
ncbi:hypothetical protein Ahy_A09g042587 [Arachis hypogaea]|uniref:Uncharacterized protein n=1 Tax=Arachis hypogaea TaxID=3818 RepID=A0A445BG99_ARAHY|nr:hypothetical protein Ahy_A09g042587 [Arachis hypogaea]